MQVSPPSPASIGRTPPLQAIVPVAAKATSGMGAVPPVSAGVEVKVAGRIDAQGALAATGTVTLDRVFMERLVRQITRKKTFGHRDVRFDAASGTYKGTVEIKVLGIPLTLAGKALPLADGGLPAFKFEALGLRLGRWTVSPPFFKQLAARIIAREITSGGVLAKVAPNAVIRLDPTTLLRDADVLPSNLSVDTSRTKFAVQTAPNGDVRIRLQSDVPPDQASDQPGSKLAMSIDEQALERVLGPLLGEDFELRSLALKPNTLVLSGQVEVKPLSNLVNIGLGLLVALVKRSGRPVGPAATDRVMVKLQLDAQLQGTVVTLTPSLGKALSPLEAQLTKAGLCPVRVGKALRFDIAPLLAPYGIEGLEVSQGQLSARSKMDINGLIKAPILRGEAF